MRRDLTNLDAVAKELASSTELSDWDVSNKHGFYMTIFCRMGDSPLHKLISRAGLACGNYVAATRPKGERKEGGIWSHEELRLQFIQYGLNRINNGVFSPSQSAFLYWTR
jgi:hypothetical protein